MDENLMNDLSAVEAPSLTLDLAPAETAETPKPAAPAAVEQTPLSPAEQKMVQDFAQQIDLSFSNQSAAQARKKLPIFRARRWKACAPRTSARSAT